MPTGGPEWDPPDGGVPGDPAEWLAVVAVGGLGTAGLGYAAGYLLLADGPPAERLLSVSLPAVVAALLCRVAVAVYAGEVAVDARTVLLWGAGGVVGLSVVGLYFPAVSAVGGFDRGLAVLLVVSAGALAGVGLGLYSSQRVRIERLERYETVVESVRDGVFAVDDDGRVTLLNPAMADLLGVDREALLGRDASEVTREMTPVGNDRGMADGGTEPPGVSLSDLAGTDRRVEVALDPEDPGRVTCELGVSRVGPGSETVVVARDVSRYRRLQQQLSVTNRILRHNLRTSTNLIEGRARALEVDAVDEATAEGARAVRQEAESLSALAEKARLLSAVVEDGDGFERASVDLAAVVREAAERLRERHPHARVSVDAPGTAEAVVHPQFERAVREVAENAVVHNPADEPRVDASVRRVEGAWELRVADDGPGIPAYEREVLFRETETALDHGSGVGLWLTKWILELSDGTLRFAGNDSGGTVVTLRVPDRQSDDHPEAGSAGGPPQSEAGSPGGPPQSGAGSPDGQSKS